MLPRKRSLTPGPSRSPTNIHVFACARRTGGWQNTWSGPVQLALWTSIPPLRITEIMYNPAPPPPGSPFNAQDFEFVELKNIGGEALNLHQFQFTRGIRFEFPNLVLAPGEHVLIVRNQEAFQSRYGMDALMAGPYEGLLDNAGERLTLVGPRGEPCMILPTAAIGTPSPAGSAFPCHCRRDRAIGPLKKQVGLASEQHVLRVTGAG